MMPFVGSVAGPVVGPIAAAVTVLLLGALGAQTWRVHGLQAQLAQEQAQLAQEKAHSALQRAAYASAAASAATANLTETARRIAEQGVNADEAAQYTSDAASAAVGRRAADERLRNATAAVAQRCRGARPGDPAAGSVSAPASSPGDLLADVQRRMGQAAEQLVEYADAARAAGRQCERDYDALTR